MREFLLLFLLCFVIGDDFTSFKQEMQDKVLALATNMEVAFSRRCAYEVATCQSLSYDDCEGTSPKKCHQDFPTPGECIGEGAYMSETSTVRFPITVDTDALTDEEKAFVCTSALLEDMFLSLDTGRQGRYGKAYIGTNLGSFRSYPSSKQVDPDKGGCLDYDPRFRPWYVTASSGAKNLILMIDTSGSMDGDRISLAKDAAISVVNTLSNSDFVGILNFATSASTIENSKITRATIEEKQKIVQKIDELTANGQTNYQAAFTKAFSLLNTAVSDEYGAPCTDGENVLLFLTDGDPTVGYTTSASLITHIDGLRNGKDITLFTYGLGSGIKVDILQDLACAFSGIMFEIEDTSSDSELATTMKNYHTYISEGVTIASPVWTEPYEDAFGFGKMVTVSMPIYYTEDGIRSVLGAAGIDVLWEQIQFGMEEEQVIDRLISNAPCHASTLTQCEIENLRGDRICENQVCNLTSNSLESCNETASVVLKSGSTTDENICCSLTVGALVGIVVAGVVVLGIVIGVIVWKVKSARKVNLAQEPPNSGRNQQPKINPNPYISSARIQQPNTYPDPYLNNYHESSFQQM